MNRILMLWPDITEGIPSIIRHYYTDIVTVDNLYIKTTKKQRIIRKFLSCAGLSTKIFFGSWKERLGEYDIIIIHANVINRTVPKALRRMDYQGRIIYWYWNPVSNCVNPRKINRQYCELWSFDKDDCHIYDMKFNTTYYFKRLKDENESGNKLAYFLGQDKNRAEYLQRLKDRIEKCSCATRFLIIRDNTSKNGKIQYSDAITYEENIYNIQKSDILVDVVQEGQTGFSLRVMESVFFKKKLITNNKSILSAPFYDRDIFYVLDQTDDTPDCLKRFITNKNVSWSSFDKYTEFYDFENWLKRFGE